MKFLHPYAAVAACILTLTYLHYTTAHNKHNLNAYLVENKRTRFTKQNYVMQQERERSDLESSLKDNAVQLYEGEGPVKEEDIPALILDYANMIRNDIILMDDEVETRTSKRENAKRVKKPNQAISEPPCSCEFNSSERDLGADSYPRYIESKVCDDTLCPPHYACQRSLYNITVLKRRSSMSVEPSEVPIHRDLRHHWFASVQVVTVGCSCLRDYVENN